MNSCVETAYYRNANGYGTIRHLGKKELHHRVQYCVANNLDITAIAGKLVRHTCDNRACINPEHLVLGTAQDNMDDMASRNRARRGQCPKKLTAEQVVKIRLGGLPTDLAKEYGVHVNTIYNVINHSGSYEFN